MKTHIVLGISLWLFLSVLPVYGQTVHHVPGDFATIQEAIDVALNGDTVLIADGTYSGEGNYNIKFTYNTISVISENGPGQCVMDCLWMGQGFLCDVFGNECMISGITIQHGIVACET